MGNPNIPGLEYVTSSISDVRSHSLVNDRGQTSFLEVPLVEEVLGWPFPVSLLFPVGQGPSLTDFIGANYNVSSIDWEKAAYSGLIAFGLSWFGNAVKWGGGELGKAAQFALSYDYALLGISNSIINVFWRGRKKL